MRVKLLYPPYLQVPPSIQMPYGLGVLTAFLRKNGISVDLDDLNAHLIRPGFYSKFSNLYKEILKYYQYQKNAGHYLGLSDRRNNSLADRLINLTDFRDFDLVGIGIAYSNQILTAFLLAEKIKKEYNIPVVVGGPYVTLYADLFFGKYNFIDYAIVGEGEVPLLSFIKSIKGKENIKNVPSLWYRNSSQIIFNRRSFYNIEDQSCPDYDGLPLEFYTRHCLGQKVIFIPYSTSRGCTSRCNFCNYAFIDGTWQTKSVEKVINDIMILKGKYKSRYFRFTDSTFNMSYSYVDMLCDKLIERKVDIKWVVTLRGDNCDKKLIVKMKKAGCHHLKWGIESASNRILKLMRKDVNIDNQVKMLQIAKEVGIINTVSLILEYPYETSNDLEKTALFIKNNYRVIDFINFYRFVIKYRTFVYDNPEEIKIKFKTTKHTFFTYEYNYEETEGYKSKRYRKALKKLRKKILRYNNRYIFFKFARFPYNIILKYFGIRLRIIRSFYVFRKFLFKNDKLILMRDF